MSLIPSWVPLLAYAFLNAAAIPAILRMRKRRSSKDISLLWQSMILVGVLVVLSYALQVEDPVFIIGGMLNSLTVGVVILTAVYYR